MKIYITYGTTDYLATYQEKYDQAILLEGDSNSALVLKQTEKIHLRKNMSTKLLTKEDL